MSATLCTWIRSILSRPMRANDASTCSRARAGSALAPRPATLSFVAQNKLVAHAELVDGLRGDFLRRAVTGRRVEHRAALLEHRGEHGLDRFGVGGAGDLAERRRAAEPDDRHLLAGLRDRPRHDRSRRRSARTASAATPKPRSPSPCKPSIRVASASVCSPSLTATSMGRRNTGLKFIGWRLEPQRLSRPLIQAKRDLVEIVLRVERQIRSVREVLPQ